MALILATGVIATETPKMNVVAVDDTKTLVAAVTDPHVATEISLINEEGDVVYYKRSKAANRFKTLLNLSHLESGNYTVMLETGKKFSKRQLQINDGRVSVLKNTPELKPVFAYDGDKLLVSFLNTNLKDVSMLVYNGSKLVFESELGDEMAIHRAFDVSKMVKGEYSFVLDGAEKSYSYNIVR